MGPKTTAACQKFGAIHCVYPGGCAVVAGTHVKKISEVFWREIGMPECMWVMEVEEFGPLIISIDAYGNNLFEENRKLFEEEKARLVQEVKQAVARYSSPE